MFCSGWILARFFAVLITITIIVVFFYRRTVPLDDLLTLVKNYSSFDRYFVHLLPFITTTASTRATSHIPQNVTHYRI